MLFEIVLDVGPLGEKKVSSSFLPVFVIGAVVAKFFAVQKTAVSNLDKRVVVIARASVKQVDHAGGGSNSTWHLGFCPVRCSKVL